MNNTTKKIVEEALSGEYHPLVMKSMDDDIVFDGDNNLTLSSHGSEPHFGKTPNTPPSDKKGILASVEIRVSKSVFDRAQNAVTLARQLTPLINEASIALCKGLGTYPIRNYRFIMRNPETDEIVSELEDGIGYKFKVYAVRN